MEIILNNGIKIPIIGYGTYQAKSGKEAYNGVRDALDFGYKHIDTAAIYGNESDVGKAIIDSRIDRDSIFITTKLWNADQGYESALKAFDQSRKKLDLDYIDLYLIHWPQTNTRQKSWEALEKLYSEKKVRAIGVSNYTITHLEELLKNYDLVPAVNQVEFSPFLNQLELHSYCKEKKIEIEAYSPLVKAQKFDNETLVKLAEKYNKSEAQILLRWNIELEMITLPKSVTTSRIKENINIFDFNLTEEDMNTLNNMNEDYRTSWDPTDLV